MVACPVACQAQIVIAKRVMLAPSSDTTWPAHTIVNPGIPPGRNRLIGPA